MGTQSLLMETGVLCVSGMMSTCAGCGDHLLQQRCGKYEKATHANRCMYLVFDEYCDNHLAQATALGNVVPMRTPKKRLIKHRDEGEFERRRTEKDRSLQRKKIRLRRRSSNEY